MPSDTELHSASHTENSHLKVFNPEEEDTDVDSAHQRKIRDEMRKRGLALLERASSSTKGLTKGDIDAWKHHLLSEAGLAGAQSDEQKSTWLRENIDRVIPSAIERVKRLESQFESDLQKATSNKWISSTSANRWKDRLKDQSTSWSVKRAFLENKFPKYMSNWANLEKDRSKVQEISSKLKITKNELPELREIQSASFVSLPYAEKKKLVEMALAALSASENGRKELLTFAEQELQRAVSKKLLAPNKVSTWMKRIFSSSASDKQVRDFLTGGGSMPLTTLVASWAFVKGRYDRVEEKRKAGYEASKFNFVSEDKFLNWHYAARLAYVEEAERRLKPSVDRKSIFGDIRRELDMKDWASALYLIDDAMKMDMTDGERSELSSMRKYAKTQSVEEPQLPHISEDKTQEKQDDMYLAMAEVASISPAIYKLYSKAIANGEGCFNAVRSIMYNRCWVHENSVLDEGDEEELRKDAAEQTKQILKEGHHRKLENNDPSFGQDAIRQHKQGEWAPQVLHLGSDGAGADQIVGACASNGSNFNFKYWTTLIPEGLDIADQKHIVYGLNWRIKAGIQAGKKMGGEGGHKIDWSAHDNQKKAA